MTDTPFEPAAADDELLSAYLLGDLSDADAEAFEARLDSEPALAAQLDTLAGALVILGSHDEVATPAGFEERLDERLRAARAGARVVSLDAARERRAGSRSWWTAIGTAAAVVAVGGVMATGVLRGIGSGGGADMAATGDEAGDPATTMESDTATIEEYSAGGGSGAGDAAADADGEAARLEDPAASAGSAAPAAPREPLVLDDLVAVRGEAALRERYAAVPEADGLLGMPVDEARSVAASFTTAVQRANAFKDAVAPADCLETVTNAAEQPLIPARVETLRYRGDLALSYVLVTATPQSDTLNRVEVWVVDARSCATLVFQQL